MLLCHIIFPGYFEKKKKNCFDSNKNYCKDKNAKKTSKSRTKNNIY